MTYKELKWKVQKYKLIGIIDNISKLILNIDTHNVHWTLRIIEYKSNKITFINFILH